jgi:hypothetical protein
MMTTWELLNDAADIIEREGHTKGTLRDQRGHCAIGALQMAAYRNRPRGYVLFVLPWHEQTGTELERAYQAPLRVGRAATCCERP